MRRQPILDAPGNLIRGSKGKPIYRDNQDRQDFRPSFREHIRTNKWIPMAEIARHLGVLASPIAKAIPKKGAD